MFLLLIDFYAKYALDMVHISHIYLIYNYERRCMRMSIKYDKLFALLKERGYTTYRIRKEGLLGQSTLTAIKNGKGGLTEKSIDKLCQVLKCQPGDLMEYIEDDFE